MTNLFPAAGLGQRFSQVGYTIPKLMLPVSGKPMIVRALQSAPHAHDSVVVFRTETIRDQHVDTVVHAHDSQMKIITTPTPTEGQACTCLLARDAINKQTPLYIGPVDAGMVYDRKKYEHLLNEPDTDVIVWAFTQRPTLLRNPKAWGWLKVTPDKKFVTSVSVKVPISDDPFNDHVIIGSFTFKTGKLFLDLADELIQRNIRVNNEFYVDSILNLAIEHGLKVKLFVVDKYLGWGVPPDYEEYLAWEQAIAKDTGDKQHPEYSFWHSFFTHDLPRWNA